MLCCVNATSLKFHHFGLLERLHGEFEIVLGNDCGVVRRLRTAGETDRYGQNEDYRENALTAGIHRSPFRLTAKMVAQLGRDSADLLSGVCTKHGANVLDVLHER